MALSRTNRITREGTITHGTGTAVSGSFTPSDNSLLILAIAGTTFTAAMTNGFTITDSAGLTWTRRGQVLFNNGSAFAALEIWTAPVATGASMTVTADATDNQSMVDIIYHLFDYTGYDTGSPIGTTGSDAALEDVGTFNLALAPASTSAVVAARYAAGHPSNTATPASGWVEIYDTFATNGTNTSTSLQSQDRTGSTSQSVDWNDTLQGTVLANLGLAVEIKAAAGGGAVVGAGLIESLALNRLSLVGA